MVPSEHLIIFKTKTNYYMKMRFLPILLLLCLGCSSDSSEPEPDGNPNPPTQGEEDTTAPSINIAGLQDVIEVLTELEVTITDTSQSVNTVLFVNGNEVFTTTQKTFSYELDPFDFPTGETEVTIQSTDDSNNQGIESGTFELKKLLFRSPDLAGFDPSEETMDIYLAINAEQSGELIVSRLIQSFEDATFYAPEGFERQEIVATRFILGKGAISNLNVAESFASLDSGIQIMTVEQAVEKLKLNRGGFPWDQMFNLTIADIPVNTRINGFSRDYAFFSGQVRYNEENTQSLFLYSQTSPNITDLDNYRYFILEEFEDTSISFNDFLTVPVENRITNNLPPGTSDYFLSIEGYLSMERYEKDNDHELFKISAGGNNNENNTYNYSFPTFSEYPILRQKLTINFNDGREVTASFRGVGKPQIPNLSISQSGNRVGISGIYDGLVFAQDIEGPIPDGNSSPILFRRSYADDDSDSVSIPFDTLELPLEVIQNLETKGFSISPTNNPGNQTIGLIKREQEIDYHDRIFYFLQRNEAGDRYGLTFPLQ